jgi:ABC-type phosphate transport system ATPase subunit
VILHSENTRALTFENLSKARKPALLLLDEPTSALDPLCAEGVEHAIAQATQVSALVFLLHKVTM